MTFFSQPTKYIVQFVGFSHLLISMGGGACVYITCIALGLGELALAPAIFISTCTGLGYSIQRFVKARLFPSSVPVDRLVYLTKYGSGLILFWFIGFITSVKCLDLHFNSITWLLLGGLGGIGVGYAVLPTRLKHFARSIREIARVKLPLLSVVWGGATVLLPLALIENVIDVSWVTLGGVFLSRVLYVAGLTIPFDVRDLDVDNSYMKTLPQAIGSRSSLNVAIMLVAGAGVIWLILIGGGYLGPNLGIPLALHAFATIPLVSPRLAEKKRHEYYYSIILDGMLVIQIVSLALVLS